MSPLALVAFGVSTIVGGTSATALLVQYDRYQPGYAFGALMGMASVWSASYLGMLLANSLQWRLLFTQLSYLGVVGVPLIWLVFALQYTDRDRWVSLRLFALLSIVPVVSLVLVFTIPWHSLFYASMAFIPEAEGQKLFVTPGPGYVLNVVYSYTILVVGTGLIASAAFSKNRMYRRPALLLLAFSTLPWLVNGSYLLGIRPFSGADPTPVALILVGMPLAVYVHWAGLTSFVPVAHERMFRTLENPVVVCSRQGKIIDANYAAQSLYDDGDVRGTSMTVGLPDALLNDGEPDPALDDGIEWTHERNGEARHYVVHRRDIGSEPERESRGSIIVFTDITVQKEQQRAIELQKERLERKTERLEAKNEQLERLAGVISHDLKTPLATVGNLVHLLRLDIDDPDGEVEQSLSDLETVHQRLEAFVEHLPALARESTDVESPVECDLKRVATDAWDVVETGPLSLRVESTRMLEADPRRLQQAFENVFRNAVEHATTTQDADDGGARTTAGRRPLADDAEQRPVRPRIEDVATDADTGSDRRATDTNDDVATEVRMGCMRPSPDDPPVGFYVEDDGPGIPPDIRDDVLHFGTGTGEDRGFGLAIVRSIVEAHGWSIDVTESVDGGARLEVITGDR
jgi:signal transduction histidine kinase